jgi:ABC-2 type transport system ATP-binding protein
VQGVPCRFQERSPTPRLSNCIAAIVSPAMNTSMKRLLATLDVETFVLDVSEVPPELPRLDGIGFRRIDERTLEAEMARTQNLNALFGALTAGGITVNSMRTKTNRLEELFVRLVEQGRAPAREKTA